jgi:hypothetical protein
MRYAPAMIKSSSESAASTTSNSDGTCSSSAATSTPSLIVPASFDLTTYCKLNVIETPLWRKTIFFPFSILAEISPEAVDAALEVEERSCKWSPGYQDGVHGLIAQARPTGAHEIPVGLLEYLLFSRVSDLFKYVTPTGSVCKLLTLTEFAPLIS